MTNVAARGSKITTDLRGPQPDTILSFGPFRLAPLRKALFENECPLRLRSRALDILTLLVRRAGGVVTKEEIIREVWPDTFVEETNLRVNIAALRKALGDGRDGRRYIVNIPGRGYCFTAPVSCLNVAPFFEAKIASTPSASNLPTRITRVIGRDDVVATVSELLAEHRFVTIVGPGGIG
jgi:DNA-binding winged helix-turn-helix (wHTH) protein